MCWLSIREPLTAVTSFAVKGSLRYLGVLLGHPTPAPACGPVVAKMIVCAHYVATLPLTLNEKAKILKVWNVPCCYLMAHFHDQTPAMVTLLNVIQPVALSVNSWGLTRGIMCKPESHGGISLPGLGVSALWVHSHVFVKYVQGTAAPSARSSRLF